MIKNVKILPIDGHRSHLIIICNIIRASHWYLTSDTVISFLFSCLPNSVQIVGMLKTWQVYFQIGFCKLPFQTTPKQKYKNGTKKKKKKDHQTRGILEVYLQNKTE